MTSTPFSLTELARAGFSDLTSAAADLAELEHGVVTDARELLPAFAHAADPDTALGCTLALGRQADGELRRILSRTDAAERLIRLVGASPGFGEFFLRHPRELDVLRHPLSVLPAADALRRDLTAAAVDAAPNEAPGDERGWRRLRVRYRAWLARVASFDLEQEDPVAGLDDVAACLSDLASAALDAALELARGAVSRADDAPAVPGTYPRAQVAAVELAVIGMGKAGARELNYVSDVDVIFVGGVREGSDLEPSRAIDIATRLAMLMTRAIGQSALEPPLWEVDANLRPEGKDGALVRSLESHLAYYERWAKSWEFQALLKANPLAGDAELGRRYIEAIWPKVWTGASREGFVESVQRMRERVTRNIPSDEVDVQIKLGPGGLRDIEFTVQLLELVHGQTDAAVRERGTLPALEALAAQSYIGRAEAAEFSRDYRVLRLMEHRLQLKNLSRTHLMPRDEAGRRTLARATGLATGADSLTTLWQDLKHRVRGLHERLFYRPLLSAVASMPFEGMALTSAQAEARLAAIGFTDPHGALAHIAALTGGVSRRASIQRHLIPVMLQWFADGADPDYGLLVFRRLSDSLGSSHWYLRMLRDSSGAAQRLTRVLSSSRYVGELLERIPESVAWLEDEVNLRPRSTDALREETAAIIARHDSRDAAAPVLRAMRRREVLRLAIAAILDVITVAELGRALRDVTAATISSILEVIRGGDDGIEFATIAMGRFGGGELGFGSDADVIHVFRATTLDSEAAQNRAKHIVAELNRLTVDPTLPLDLDIDLRPEGKNGPVARSLDSYRAYYARWSLTWEAQALLRAHAIAGDVALGHDFHLLADETRYPVELSENAVREIRRIKARVENERLPLGADPTRHLKLGRGSLSDVEWLVQLLQLQHAAELPSLRTTSTLNALAAAQAADLIDGADAEILRAAWIIASRARSAMTLWTNRTADVLPSDRVQLEGVARILAYPPGSSSQLEQDYLSATRRARVVFERLFYGEPQRTTPTTG
ncbi:bifunctional [glutamine synthetase] adenylyltransferase/[glutamine synthetase]-adenylyl-L-tyrosine phosphorylase [Glaciibacter flavus]|uniref:Bifunctional [glutamine synthetase] adenylyltransferase/[glutamine synthetase]-adenylyl-L-tyrosine phosphorylase n=1 Tax=Orlajensenia flava TaxID=2565934 RepID=A0A4S4FW04_9MICO|nr:bifunctional [glutamine synthetase] adenylyltransferase/[glutamine synthetase]-adenylyl-L-tyrosine phosphorylase [Glaciibacter flavus]THG35119.1 bifunctional [glutamine synthetase] adenylyltransferase/[glutamine synthetase]-adenylyl-L-tyrosine phosphorylase [Glaciibacter flavus]